MTFTVLCMASHKNTKPYIIWQGQGERIVFHFRNFSLYTAIAMPLLSSQINSVICLDLIRWIEIDESESNIFRGLCKVVMSRLYS